MPKTAHIEADHAANAATGSTDKLTKVATETTERGSDAVREGVRVAQRTAGAVGEMQHQTSRQSAKGTMELGQLFVTLFNEQAQHNLQLATAFGRAVTWDQVVQIQRDFARGSFERMNRLNSRYLEIIQAGMKSMAFTART